MRAEALHILTVAILSSVAFATCGQGCLKCNTAFDICMLCDFVSNYVLNSENTCSIKKREQCQVMSPVGDCMQCATGYFFDNNQDACLPVPKINLVQNCEYYANSSSCQTCFNGYYLSKNQCLAIQYTINGCVAYASANRCSECDIGTVLHPSGNRCVSIATSQCLFQNHLRCDACAKGYGLDYKYFTEGLFGTNTVNLDIIVPFITNAAINGVAYSQLKTPCRPLQIANCAEYDSFTVCKKCAKNYFLADKGASCRAFPYPALPNCESYTYYNSCSSCAQGFLLAGPNDCQPVRPILNCAKYSQTSVANICTNCTDAYYVSGNICIIRQNKIEHCAAYQANEDKCVTCDGGFGLTSDYLACLPVIPNCATYQSSAKTNAKLICMACADGYFYNSNNSSCDTGQITNCKEYQNNSSSTCITCVNKYYLENGACKPHKDIPKCNNYSSNIANACTSCDNTSFLNTQNIGCAVIKGQIPQCVEYASPLTCKNCAERYYLSTGSCLAIPANERCLIKNATLVCTKCEPGYLLISGVCSLPLDVQTLNCHGIQNNGLSSTFTCNKCKRNTIPWNYKNQYVCLSTTTLGANSVNNCVKYEFTGGVYKCRKCADGYFITETNTCITDINTPLTHAVVLNYNGSLVNLGGNLRKADIGYDLFKDMTGDIQFCKYVVYANDNTKQCLNCKTGYTAFVNFGSKKSHINPESAKPSSFTPTLGYGFNTYTCALTGTPTYYPGGTAAVPANCESFIKTGTNFLCKACRRGYTGKVDVQGGVNYQFCNVAIPDCNTDVTYGGLIFEYGSNPFGMDLLVYLSCHACYSPNKVPVMFGTVAGDLAPFGLAVSDNLPTAEAVKNDVTVQCMEIKLENFKYKPEQSLAKVVDNCGVMKYNVNVAKRFADLDAYNTSPGVCAVCKPGYIPTRLNNIIVRCDPIAHCNMKSNKKWFNTCGECQTGYTWFYNPTTHAIDFSRCVPLADINCLAAVADNTDLSAISSEFPKGRCAMCKSGFSFNLDYVCEAISAPLCKQNSFVKGTYILSTTVANYDIFNLFNKHHDGCNECVSPYVSIRQASDFYECTVSEFVKLGAFSEVSNYVQHCRRYSNEGSNVMCRECQEGFIPSMAGDFCIEQGVYPNCERASANGTTCAQCQAGYVLVNEYCERPNILQCGTYAAGQDYQKCLTCIGEFKLVNNKCVPGHVENCRIYNTNETCTVCADFYLLVTLVNNRQACLPINTELNCRAVFTAKVISTQELECVTCADGYAPTSDKNFFDNYVCQNIREVDNCEVYDVNTLPNKSSLKCTECKSQFYLVDNRCIARQVTTSNCKNYSMVNDFCAECEDGFYLSNEKECINFPRGIYGCIDYISEDSCAACDKRMFLSGSSCTAVTNLIHNCAYYRDANTCSRCEFNFFLKDNACVKAVALNCQTYDRIDRCGSCLDGFGLIQAPQTGVVDCIFIPNLNCGQSELVYPFNCLRCSSLFYNERGRCLAVDQAIANCDIYGSPVTCMKCQEGFVLSLDGKRCMDSAEAGIKPYEKCIDNKMTLKPHCNVCKFGFKFVSGACSACVNNTPVDGCMYCAGENDSVCNVCMPGYYMTKNNKCFLNSSAPSALQAGDASSR